MSLFFSVLILLIFAIRGRQLLLILRHSMYYKGILILSHLKLVKYKLLVNNGSEINHIHMSNNIKEAGLFAPL